MSADQPGREEQEETSSASAAAKENEEQMEEIVDTQERTDALASAPEDDSVEEHPVTDPEPGEESTDNINTDEDATPEDAGEIPGGPDAGIDPTEVEESSEETEPESEQPEASAEESSEAVAESPAPAQPEEDSSDESGRSPGIKRGDLLDGTISSTSPVQIVVALDNGVEGVIPGRELERMTRQVLDTLQEGEQVKVYVINPHDHQGNVLLSINRAIEEMDWQEAESYRANQQIYEGHVAGYNKGGLIVRFGRLRGFVPQSQISEDRRARMEGETPEERYSHMVNDNIVVKVMEVDRSRNRLILSERAASRERRERRKESLINELYVGQVCDGRVVSLEDFGAFVDVGGAEGLVHLTEIAWKHVTHPRESLSVGQPVRVEVISVDQDRKRIGLSIKRQEADPWDEVATTYQVGDLVQATITKLTKFGAFARLVDAEDIEGLIHISELSEQRVNHPREVVNEDEKLTLRVVKIDVKHRRLGLSLKRVNSAEYLDRDLDVFAGNSDE